MGSKTRRGSREREARYMEVIHTCMAKQDERDRLTAALRAAGSAMAQANTLHRACLRYERGEIDADRLRRETGVGYVEAQRVIYLSTVAANRIYAQAHARRGGLTTKEIRDITKEGTR